MRIQVFEPFIRNPFAFFFLYKPLFQSSLFPGIPPQLSFYLSNPNFTFTSLPTTAPHFCRLSTAKGKYADGKIMKNSPPFSHSKSLKHPTDSLISKELFPTETISKAGCVCIC
jgi:hypothetical protein